MRVSARSWCRVDLAGGTLDIWPLGLLHPGASTVNVAIDVAVTVRLAPRRCGYRVRQGDSEIEAPDLATLGSHPETALVAVIAEHLGLPPVDVSVASDSPRGGGLAASSAMAVALLGAGESLLGREASTARQRAHLARDLEARLMRLPTGCQDHYPALLGGALEISYPPGGEVVRRLDVDLDELARRLLVVYSGQSHFSAETNWQVIRRRLEGEGEATALFAGIAATASELAHALTAGDWPRVGELVGQEWSLRRRLAEGVSTPRLEALLATARSLGAWGGKACGAGGGGCLAILCPPDQKTAIAAALTDMDARVIDARPTTEPAEVARESRPGRGEEWASC